MLFKAVAYCFSFLLGSVFCLFCQTFSKVKHLMAAWTSLYIQVEYFHNKINVKLYFVYNYADLHDISYIITYENVL